MSKRIRSILAGISIGMLKMDGTLKFIESLRYIESTIWIEPHSFDMPTISGVIRRNFTVTDPTLAKNFVWMCYALGIIAFSVQESCSCGVGKGNFSVPYWAFGQELLHSCAV